MSEKKILPGSERPDTSALPDYLTNYIDQAEGGNLYDALEIALDRTLKMAKAWPENAGLLKYADNKWTINELLQHMIDAERVFCYRALRFARNDKTDLSGYDHDTYVPESKANRRRTDLLLKELIAVRMSTIALFVSFTEEMLRRIGTANGSQISVQALAWVIAGHNAHHLRIIQERYFVT